MQRFEAKDQVIDILEYNILSGNFKPGEHLNQVELAKSLGISRMPIREALQTLEMKGLIEKLPNRHMKIVDLNRESVHEIFKFICENQIIVSRMLLRRIIKDKNLEEQIIKLTEKFKGKKFDGQTEFQIHNEIMKLCSNYFISKNILNMFSGFVNFTLTNVNNYEVESIINSLKYIQNNELENLNTFLKKYYEILENAFYKNLEDKINV